MPTETSRLVATKRITNPEDESQFVDVPVLTSVTFVDPHDRYQEIQMTFLNDETGDRTVHVKRVYNSNDTGDYVDVERIEKFSVIDPHSRYQESEYELDNVTGDDTTPPRLTTHLKTHIFRITNPDNTDCWVDMERIDQLALLDPHNRYQETIYELGPWDDESEQQQ